METSNERDFIILDKHLDENTGLEYNINNIRINKDHVIDARGKRLISLRQSANLLICNGRLLEDSIIGESTFLNNNAIAVIDYVLANQHDFKCFFLHLKVNQIMSFPMIVLCISP